ncbi:hypothetical protein [Sulfurovum mangrovi]|uniref:hypothetical protein n=1 Tax=Sulfurovum mangrovi TaxID=2893889 RepID=UPI001E46FE30|nr:hypothetical protein [Sulfurovum mangrovi]UFH59977.1 hypothetical protein LN246_03800 [Sulfurovum mangrovi]
MALQTEFEFTLPQGYVDGEGNLHKHGVMKLATAKDEILPQKDPRVIGNPAYLSVILLSRVVTQLGSLEDVTPAVIENLFIQDLSYLQALYSKINEGSVLFETVCPYCNKTHEVRFDRPKE